MEEGNNNLPIIIVNSHTNSISRFDPHSQRFAKHDALTKNLSHLTRQELGQMYRQACEIRDQKIAINKEIILDVHAYNASLNYEPLDKVFTLYNYHLATPDKNLISTVDKLIPIFYTPQGYSNLTVNAYERTIVARIVADALKVKLPYAIYVETITAYAAQYSEFKEIVAQETRWFPWAKEKVTEWCGLIKGHFYAKHPLINIDVLKKNILAHGFKQSLLKISDSRLNTFPATNMKKVDAQCCSDVAHALGWLQKNKELINKDILSCKSLDAVQDYLSGTPVERRLVPLTANLLNEIQHGIESKAEQSHLMWLQESLLQLDTCAGKVCAESSYESKAALIGLISEIETQLGVLTRPELRRSPSMEKLFAPQTDLLFTSKDVGAISLAELKKFSGTPEQNALNLKMIDHVEKIHSCYESIVDNDAKQIIETYNALISQAHELTKDSYITAAEGVFTVAKDLVEIALIDPPVNEICDYLEQTVSNPQDYVLKTVEGYKSVAGAILNACKYTLERPSAAPEQNFQFALNQNKAIHAFFDGWEKLEVQQKKEFLAQIVVDTAINKVAYSLPKLILKIGGGSSAISSAIQKAGSAFDKIDPGASGVVAVAVPANIAESVVGAIEHVAEVVGSIPVAVATAGIQDTVMLSEAMQGGGNNVPNKTYECPASCHFFDKEDKVLRIIDNEVIKNIRSGSALKLDAHHAFNNMIDNYVEYAQKFELVGDDGISRPLFQIKGSLNGVEGIFEWIVDPNSLNGVTHRLFIKNGIITGKPSIFPSMKK